jgi:hypothetical protein
MRRYHQERSIIRRHHREHLRGQHTEPQTHPVGLPRGCFRKRHALPLHLSRDRQEAIRNRQEWQASKTLLEGVQEFWQERLSRLDA